MIFLSWNYLILSFFEPISSKDIHYNKNSKTFTFLYYFEFFIIFFFLIDLFMDSCHRFYNDSKNFFENYIKNQKYFWKFLSVIFFVIDAILYFSQYPNYKIFRFSKIFRPSNNNKNALLFFFLLLIYY